MLQPDDAAASFAPLRPRLVRIAYRMLGLLAEAEDIVQEAYLRWHQTDRAGVRNPAAFLTRTVTRLCLDHLKSARVRRETYIGPWLPEPVIEIDHDDDRDDITMSLMLVLERLSPLERAAFLLHDVFGMAFDDVAQAIDRDPAACRQLATRARAHVRAARPRFPVSEERSKDIASAFFRASRGGDVQALQKMLAADVVAYTDGGGKMSAALNPLYGQEKVTRFFAGLARKAGNILPPLLRLCSIDGLPGFVSLDSDGALQTTALELEDGRIVAIYVTRNPDKLRHVAHMTAEQLPH